MLAPQHAYALLVVAHNNPSLPPPLRMSSLAEVVRSGWRLDGAAQFLSGRVPHLRTAIGRRLRGGPAPLPPGVRDSSLLGGALFDLLARERGREAVVGLALSPRGDSSEQIEDAFGSSLAEIGPRWQTHVERLARADPVSQGR